MSSKLLCFAFVGSLGLSLLLGNSIAFAQVVVPTDSTGGSSFPPNGSSVPIDTSTGGIPTSTPVDGVARFSCQTNNGQYTIMYQPQSQPGQYFAWATPASLGGGWNSQLRCQTIANRLETYRPDGLQELQTAVENNENTICVTTEANPTCRIVLTVPRGRDPFTVRNSVFQNLMTADSGQQTLAVNTYANRGRGNNDLYNLGRTLLGGGNNQVSSSRRGLNLQPFLDPKDGGNGSGLKNGVAIRSRGNTSSSGAKNTNNSNNPRLDPNRFRR
ncbi:COP23 domain-containing protein [Fortiea contorta]|uniref:COP23 domain-containing protein n=1 Tax=Fortiea contorta TaxID=1892405 RepID=UPI00034D8C59|nr:COP23 domain-containing protein [Fortiea contorta]